MTPPRRSNVGIPYASVGRRGLLGLGAAALFGRWNASAAGLGVDRELPTDGPHPDALDRPFRPLISGIQSEGEIAQVIDSAYSFTGAGGTRDVAFRLHNHYHQAMCAKLESVHGTLDFLTWHRAFLIFHERSRQMLAGVPKTFRLPCWDWNQNHVVTRGIPPIYQYGDLYDQTRNANLDLNDTQKPNAVMFQTSLAALKDLATSDYSVVRDRIESVHNFVHYLTGGRMDIIETSAGDPLFYAHHAQVDRLFGYWLDELGGLEDILADGICKDWLSTRKYEFSDGVQPPMTTWAKDLLDANALNYSYDYADLKLWIPKAKIVNRLRFQVPLQGSLTPGSLVIETKIAGKKVQIHQQTIPPQSSHDHSTSSAAFRVDVVMSDSLWKELGKIPKRSELQIFNNGKKLPN